MILTDHDIYPNIKALRFHQTGKTISSTCAGHQELPWILIHTISPSVNSLLNWFNSHVEASPPFSATWFTIFSSCFPFITKYCVSRNEIQEPPKYNMKWTTSFNKGKEREIHRYNSTREREVIIGFNKEQRKSTYFLGIL